MSRGKKKKAWILMWGLSWEWHLSECNLSCKSSPFGLGTDNNNNLSYITLKYQGKQKIFEVFTEFNDISHGQ